MNSLPNYEGTAEEYAKYGERLSIWQQIALIQRYAPLIGYAQRFVQTADPYKQGVIISEACEWLASNTGSTLDDELVKHLAAVLRSAEGEALVRWVLLKVEEMRK
jgi:hypothetical protein